MSLITGTLCRITQWHLLTDDMPGVIFGPWYNENGDMIKNRLRWKQNNDTDGIHHENSTQCVMLYDPVIDDQIQHIKNSPAACNYDNAGELCKSIDLFIEKYELLHQYKCPDW